MGRAEEAATEVDAQKVRTTAHGGLGRLCCQKVQAQKAGDSGEEKSWRVLGPPGKNCVQENIRPLLASVLSRHNSRPRWHPPRPNQRVPYKRNQTGFGGKPGVPRASAAIPRKDFPILLGAGREVVLVMTSKWNLASQHAQGSNLEERAVEKIDPMMVEETNKSHLY